jgi:glycosyltransferase involved in cell wall biosynthesis
LETITQQLATPLTTSLTIAHLDGERGFSGGEKQVFLLMEGLRVRGHENLLLCPPGSRSEEEARRRGIEVRPVAMPHDLSLAAVLGLRRALRRGEVDIAHLHTGRATWLGGIAAHLARVPAITTRRMDRRVKRNWRTRLIFGRLVERAVAISDAVGDCLREGGVSEAILRTIPSSVDPRALEVDEERSAIRAELGLGEEECVLLTLASLVPRKGLDILLEALASLGEEASGARCLIAGEGPEREALEARADRLGLGERVRFLGRRSDPARLLAACDIFVLPSRREGLGVAALEAMAAGRPVVASRIGGLADAVGEGCAGILVEPGDVADLARALARLFGDRDARERLGAAGPPRVAASFHPEGMCAAYEKLYREVLDGR